MDDKLTMSKLTAKMNIMCLSYEYYSFFMPTFFLWECIHIWYCRDNLWTFCM